MKVNVSFSKKVPGAAEYSSDHFSLSIEAEPPAEVQQDRERLRSYTEELFSECQARVNDQVVAAGAREPAVEPAEPRSAPSSSPSRRAPGRAIRNGAPQNGRAAPRADDGLASPKQVNFLRSLGAQNGMSYGQIAALAEETFGKRDLRELTKKEASSLIDQLRSEAA